MEDFKDPKMNELYENITNTIKLLKKRGALALPLDESYDVVDNLVLNVMAETLAQNITNPTEDEIRAIAKRLNDDSTYGNTDYDTPSLDEPTRVHEDSSLIDLIQDSGAVNPDEIDIILDNQREDITNEIAIEFIFSENYDFFK